MSRAMPKRAAGCTSWANACAAAEHGMPSALASKCATDVRTGSPVGVDGAVGIGDGR